MRVFELPPNGQGITALQMLNIIETLRPQVAWAATRPPSGTRSSRPRSSPTRTARASSPIRLLQARRPPVDGLLSKDYARERAKLIDPARAAARIEAGHPPLGAGDTTYLAVADGDGNMVSLIQSNYSGFGSGYVARRAGASRSTTAARSSTCKPGLPNSLEPGKRPFHTIIPAFAMKDGKPWLAFGLMGGDMQPQGHVQVLVNLVDFGMNLQEAGDAARFYHTGSSEPTGTLMTTGGVLHLESGVPGGGAPRPREHGPPRRRETVGTYGGYQAVMRDPVTGVYAGATESRKDGCAMGY